MYAHLQKGEVERNYFAHIRPATASKEHNALGRLVLLGSKSHHLCFLGRISCSTTSIRYFFQKEQNKS